MIKDSFWLCNHLWWVQQTWGAWALVVQAALGSVSVQLEAKVSFLATKS